YKQVKNRIKPVATTLPEEYKIGRRIDGNPLEDLPPLPTDPPPFTPGKRLTQERLDAMELNKDGFMLPAELQLLHHILKTNEMYFAWDESEKGKFKDSYFDPVIIPTIEHVPWQQKNIPIPP
ncbi:hypothetical protein SISNIDRAFT_393753, partial [Sistotremastrum niveocremeum HHB9708]